MSAVSPAPLIGKPSGRSGPILPAGTDFGSFREKTGRSGYLKVVNGEGNCAFATIFAVSFLATKLHSPVRMRDRLREILAQHGRLSVPVEQVGDRSDLYQAGLTSLATVGLMLAIEDAFDIEFPDALLSRKTFRSIDALAVAIEQLQVKA